MSFEPCRAVPENGSAFREEVEEECGEAALKHRHVVVVVVVGEDITTHCMYRGLTAVSSSYQ